MTRLEIRPNPGPQERYLGTRADIAIYGGAAGSGKSFATILDPLRHAGRPGFRAVMFRRESTRLIGSGSLWEESEGIYPLTGAISRQSPVLEWRWASGAKLELRHLQHEKDKHAHQGKQYAAIYFDEITEFTESQVLYLISRLRTTCGIRPYMRATCNPDPDSFVRRWIDWWIGDDGLPIAERSGVLRWFARDGDDMVWFGSEAEAIEAYPDRRPLSFTFIPARLSDNPAGDPTYYDRLMALPRVERERLLGGNWDIRPTAGDYFQRGWFEIVEAVPSNVVASVRAWDKAATSPSDANSDPNWTRGVLMHLHQDKSITIEHGESLRAGPHEVMGRMRAIASQDGRGVKIAIWQDPGQAGVVDVDATARELFPHALQAVRASKDKVSYASAWSPHAKLGRVRLVRGPWNDSFLRELEAFPTGAHDDWVDAASLGFQALTGGGAFRFRSAMERL